MSRPLRIEFPGALSHVTSRGDRREPIYVDDDDRRTWLAVLAHAVKRFDAQVLAYCLMGNHYHVVLNTRQPNLSMLMRQLNGVYTQAFNRRHGKVGHVFQGRFKAILVDRDAYLLELCRYVELNPVRAGMVQFPGEWPWSSYLAHVGQTNSPEWLDTAGLHGYLLGCDVSSPSDHHEAARRYAALVDEGRGLNLWGLGLRQQIYLGDDAFVQRMLELTDPTRQNSRETPRVQRKHVRDLAWWLDEANRVGGRDAAIYRAHVEGGWSMSSIARALGLSVSRVSHVVAAQEMLTAFPNHDPRAE